MIITQVTIKGFEHWVYLKRQENPLRVTIERSVHHHGNYRMPAGTIHKTDSLDTLYILLGPLFYGQSSEGLSRMQRAEMEGLVLQILQEEVDPSSRVG